MLSCCRWVYTGNKSGPDATNGWEKQPFVSVLTVEARHKEDMSLYLIRKPHCVAVDVRGATGEYVWERESGSVRL